MFNFLNKTPKVINIYSPLDGEILPLAASPDAAFAQGMMGEGICINPTQDTLYSPFDCEVNIFHTLHAIGCNDGTIEAIVHIGMNTVQLNGEGFKALAPLQGAVKNQTPLISFDKEALLSKVSTLITPVIVVEKPENATLQIIKNSGTVKAGELIMQVTL